MVEHFLKTGKILGIFALVSFIAGALFISNGRITGNVVVNNYHPVSTLSIVGLLLILGSFIITSYLIKKR